MCSEEAFWCAAVHPRQARQVEMAVRRIALLRQLQQAGSALRSPQVSSQPVALGGSHALARVVQCRGLATVAVDHGSSSADPEFQSIQKTFWAGLGLGIASAFAIHRYVYKIPAKEAGTDSDVQTANPQNTSPARDEDAASDSPDHIEPFSVKDQDGRSFSQENLLGNFAVLSIGKASDGASNENLQKLMDAKTEIDRRSNMQYAPAVFVATDHKEDDDPSPLKEITEQMSELTAVFGEQVNKIVGFLEKYLQSHPDAPQDVSSSLFVLNPEGKIIRAISTDEDVGAAAAEVGEEVIRYSRANPTWKSVKATKPAMA